MASSEARVCKRFSSLGAKGFIIKIKIDFNNTKARPCY